MRLSQPFNKTQGSQEAVPLALYIKTRHRTFNSQLRISNGASGVFGDIGLIFKTLKVVLKV